MPKTSTKKSRSKLTKILIAPALAIVFAIGWSLYYIGHPRHMKNQKPTKTTQPKPENIELMMIPQEEKITITN
jgi:hypothetical protein